MPYFLYCDIFSVYLSHAACDFRAPWNPILYLVHNISINLFMLVCQWQARRQGDRHCHSHGQALFHHHVIAFMPFRVPARDTGSYLRMPQLKVFPWLHCTPLKSVTEFTKIVQRQLQGREVVGGFVLPFGMVGLGLSTEHERPEHPEPLLGSKSQELRTALLLL